MARPRKEVAPVEKVFVPPPYNPVKALTKNRKKRRSARAFVFGSDERAAVLHLVSVGFSQRQVAEVLGISVDALRDNFEEELVQGRTEKVAAVANNLFEIAMSKAQNAVPAAMYILKQHGGEQWRDVSRTEITGKDGGAIAVENRVIDPSRLSDEDREALRDMMMKALEKKPVIIEGEIIENDAEDLV